MGVAELGLEPAVAQPGCIPWHRTCPQHPPEEAGGGWGVASGFVSVPVERSQPGYRPPPGTAWLQGDGAGKSPGACAGFPEGRDGPIRVGRAARRPPAPRGSPAAPASHGFVSAVDFLQLQEQKNCTERGVACPPPCCSSSSMLTPSCPLRRIVRAVHGDLAEICGPRGEEVTANQGIELRGLDLMPQETSKWKKASRALGLHRWTVPPCVSLLPQQDGAGSVQGQQS